METYKERTTNALNEWFRSNIITVSVLLITGVVGYIRLDSQVQTLEQNVQRTTQVRDTQIQELRTNLDIVKTSYVSRVELNGTVVSRLDRIEEKLDRAIENKSR